MKRAKLARNCKHKPTIKLTVECEYLADDITMQATILNNMITVRKDAKNWT